MKKEITIITHSSKYHADDIFAVATLELLLEKEYEIKIIRTRDLEVISTGDYVVDVGGEYDPDKNRFDHHQKGGAGIRENTMPYSSFGLVWRKFGEKLCGGSLEAQERIDKKLVQYIDAFDNGIQTYTNLITDVYPYTLRSLSYIFRPTWKEEDLDLDEFFKQLVSYAKVILQRQIKCTVDEIEGELKVIEAYNNSEDKRIVILDERYPWEDILNKFPEPLFVAYKKRIDETWSLKAIRNNLEDYVCRKDFPESWAGKRDLDLEKVTGVEGAIFCHNRKFLVVAKTKEAILQLAGIAINS